MISESQQTHEGMFVQLPNHEQAAGVAKLLGSSSAATATQMEAAIQNFL